MRYVAIRWVFLTRGCFAYDDQLVADALKATGFRTKKEAVEERLKSLIFQWFIDSIVWSEKIQKPYI